jgi:transforming growth factor-beta-induced protein
LLPMLTRKAETPSLDIKSPSSINANLPNPNLSGILGTLKSPNFDILKGAITSSGLVDTINKSTPLTMLAPTNAAFQALSPDALINLQKPENKLNLGNILKNHLFSGNLDLNGLKDGASVKSLQGADLPVKITDGKLFIDGVEVEKTVDETGNGITAYSISKLLPIPETTKAAEPAPIPAQPVSAVVETPKSDYKAGSALDTLNAKGNFKTLLAAINAADLKTVLEGDGPFTIFAPNDDALKSVQPTVDDLLKPENKTKLQTFLKNHVALGKNTFEDFKANKIVTTLSDQRVILRTNESGVGRVEGLKNTAQAPIPDIVTNNAVVHTLTDTPLLI